ncbi:radical activating enzyme [Trabulsiella guamensis ATCC 49490]|uniref:Radical activating enzyme n=2 Tax=Trabulsiella guamensis TaxID=158852 RepID=A0A085AC44_9ENTR|nr:radical activating enzyme [Trabulsiella guamensis ATCC 49490]
MAQTLDMTTIINHIVAAEPFIEGITVSGGEATTQLPFVEALFRRVKQTPALSHLTCLIDSNGELSIAGWEKLYPVCDGVMVDLKAWNDDRHRWLTGRDNARIKASIRWLAQHQRLSELRLLVIPEYNDYLAAIEPLSAFIATLGDVPVRLNAFHAHGLSGEAKNWRSARPDDIQTLADALQARGITRLIHPALYL